VFEPVFFLTPFETKLLSVVVFPSSFLRRSSTMGAGASAETLANASFEEVKKAYDEQSPEARERN